MNVLSSPTRRTLLFACLYFSEGAPIGFLWFALPTQLRADGVPIDDITWLTAVLLIPWTMKFLWAPLVDLLRSPRFTLKHWILLAQSVMGITLVPLLILDMRSSFFLVAGCLLVHAFAAATQDVAIDALCISVTTAEERGRLNGWMQAGMLLGRSTMGGGALILAKYVDEKLVVVLLIGCTTFSMGLVKMIPTAALSQDSPRFSRDRVRTILQDLKRAVTGLRTWQGLLLAVIGGAAFKSFEGVLGPYLVDRDFSKAQAGLITMGPMIGFMVLGALAGGFLNNRFSRLVLLAAGLVFMAGWIAGIAVWDVSTNGHLNFYLMGGFLCLIAFGIGWFTAISYALFMDFTTPAIAATQFSAFMGATNACESWSVFTIGKLIKTYGYPTAFFSMATFSLLALPILWWMGKGTPLSETSHSPDNPLEKH